MGDLHKKPQEASLSTLQLQPGFQFLPKTISDPVHEPQLVINTAEY